MKKEARVTPWEVKGEVDYNKVVKEFGVSKISEELLERIKKHTKELHFMLRRGIFFAHRDLNWLLDEYEKGNNFFSLHRKSAFWKSPLGAFAALDFYKMAPGEIQR